MEKIFKKIVPGAKSLNVFKKFAFKYKIKLDNK